MCVCACVHTHVLKMEAWMRVDGWMLESSRQWEQAMQSSEARGSMVTL